MAKLDEKFNRRMMSRCEREATPKPLHILCRIVAQQKERFLNEDCYEWVASDDPRWKTHILDLYRWECDDPLAWKYLGDTRQIPAYRGDLYGFNGNEHLQLLKQLRKMLVLLHGCGHEDSYPLVVTDETTYDPEYRNRRITLGELLREVREEEFNW